MNNYVTTDVPKVGKTTRLWEKVSDQLYEQMQNGTLENGERLPSIRSLSNQFDVSITTIQRALDYLAGLGMIQTIPRSRSIVISPNSDLIHYDFEGVDVCVDKAVAAMLADASNPNFQTLGSAVLSKDLAAEALLKRCLGAVARDGETLISAFDGPPGDLKLRKHIAGHMTRRGIICGPDDIIVTGGDTVALELGLMASGMPGDKVIVEEPTYFGILQAIEHVGMRAVPIDTSPETGINLSVVEKALKNEKFAAIFLNPNLQNPRGFIMPEDRRIKLAKMAKEADVTIIEDDVFFDLLPLEEQVAAIKSHDANNVIYCSSFTKTIAPGFRVGWCIPGKHRDAILAQMFGRNLSVSGLPQKVLAEFMTRGYHETHLENLCVKLQQSTYQIEPLLTKYFPLGFHYLRPVAGFVHWIELPETVDMPRFHRLVKSAGISIAEGSIFSSTGATENCLRICLAQTFDASVAGLIAKVGACAVEASR